MLQLSPHKYTDDPLLAWEMLKNNRPVKTVRQVTALIDNFLIFRNC